MSQQGTTRIEVWTIDDSLKKFYYHDYDENQKLCYCVELSDIILNVEYLRSLYSKGFKITRWEITGVISTNLNPAILKIASSTCIRIRLDRKSFKIKKAFNKKIWRRNDYAQIQIPLRSCIDT